MASGDVLEPVRQHPRDPSYDVDVGPGWRQLVFECHQVVVAEFPEYELLAVKQKWGALAFQAFPRPWKPGGNWTDAEQSRLHAVTDAFADRSEGICERCAAEGSLRESRRVHLVLCDRYSFVRADLAAEAAAAARKAELREAAQVPARAGHITAPTDP